MMWKEWPVKTAPNQGIDQYAVIEVEPHPSPPGGPLTLQLRVDLLTAQAFGSWNGGLEVKQLGQKSASRCCGLGCRCDRHVDATGGRPGRQLQGPVLFDLSREGEATHGYVFDAITLGSKSASCRKGAVPW